MRITMISDVHCQWHKLVIPECDLLISCGDYSFRGEQSVVQKFHKWLAQQPAKHIISVQGNHEIWVEQNFNFAKRMVADIDDRIHFIDEGPVMIAGRLIWCSAITPWFYSWAWNKYRGPDIKKHWDLIPDDTEVLVTHGPPLGILDQVDGQGEHLGCEDLMQKVFTLSKLKLHVFGHIHSGSGQEQHSFGRAKDFYIPSQQKVQFINAAICDESYQAVQPVRTFVLED